MIIYGMYVYFPVDVEVKILNFDYEEIRGMEVMIVSKYFTWSFVATHEDFYNDLRPFYVEKK